jgi:hypothetical protein
VDDSATTAWQSADDETPVAFVVGLSTPTALSKVFVTFQAAPSYEAAMLQFSTSNDTEWRNLQYYAEDCMASFNMATNSM